MTDLTLQVTKKKKSERDSKDGNKGPPAKKAKGKVSASQAKKECEPAITKAMILNGELYSDATKLLIDELKKQRESSRGIISTKDQVIRQMGRQVTKERLKSKDAERELKLQLKRQADPKKEPKLQKNGSMERGLGARRA